jgi:hypothetical protein
MHSGFSERERCCRGGWVGAAFSLRLPHAGAPRTGIELTHKLITAAVARLMQCRQASASLAWILRSTDSLIRAMRHSSTAFP